MLNLPLICAGFLCQEHLEDPGILPNIPSCCNFIREVSLLEILPPSLELSCTALTLTQWRKRTLTQTCLCPGSVSSAFRAQVFRCPFNTILLATRISDLLAVAARNSQAHVLANLKEQVIFPVKSVMSLSLKYGLNLCLDNLAPEA